MLRLGERGDEHGDVGFKIHSFSTFDQVKKWNGDVKKKSDKNAYFIEVGDTVRTVNLYAVASAGFEIAC